MAEKHIRQSFSSKSKYVCTKYVRTQCTLKYRFYRHVDAVRLKMHNTELFLNIYKNFIYNLSCHATRKTHTQEVPGHTQRSRGQSQVVLLVSEVNDVQSLFPSETVFKRKTGNYSNYLTDF